MPDYTKPQERLALLSEVIDDTSSAMTDDLESEIRMLNYAISDMIDILKPGQVDLMLSRVLERVVEDPDTLMSDADLDVKAQVIKSLESALEISGMDSVIIEVSISPAGSLDQISDEDFDAIGVHDISVIEGGRSMSEKVLDVVHSQIPMSTPEHFYIEMHQDGVKIYPE